MDRHFAAFVGILLASTALAADWPGFRGPRGLAVSDEKGLPVRWSDMENLVWKTKLPGPGSSCPIVWKDRVYLTCYTGYGLVKNDPSEVANLRLHLLSIDRTSGKIIWDSVTPTKTPEAKYTHFIMEHGYASSTPATDGERIYVYFGRTGALAFDLGGKQLWHTEVGKYLNSWGSGSSPAVAGKVLIIGAGVESSAVVGLDKMTGKELWRVKGIGDAWSTPLLVDVPGGKTEVVLNNKGTIMGIDPESGEKLWTCEGIDTPAATSSPVARDGIVYVTGGNTIVAVKAGGRGDVTATHILWKQKGGPGVGSPVLAGDHLYWIGATGGSININQPAAPQTRRLFDGGGREYGSPVAADGKIYYFSRYGGAYVLSQTPKLEQLAHNELGDKSQFNASPAISNGQIFIRSDQALYCIGEKKN